MLAHVAVARLHLTGAPGFAQTLATIRALLDQRWEQVHPRLDPDDGNDPTLRGNALLRLADPGWVLRPLRALPLASSPRHGVVTWRHAMIASGALDADPAIVPKPTEGTLRGVFADTDQHRLAELREALACAAAEAEAIPAAFDRNAGFGTGPELTPLIKLVREMLREIDRYRPARVEAAEEQAAGAPAAAPPGDVRETPEGAVAPASGKVTALSLRAIATRAEAMHLLDLVAEYYRTAEPSSPMILLIARARRLADMGFLDILRDLAPDGLTQAQLIAGQQE